MSKLSSSQEYLFYQVYRELGLSHDGIMNHFTCVHFDVRFHTRHGLMASLGIVWETSRCGMFL